MKDCASCEHSMISDWKQDVSSGKATPEYWCKKKKAYCEDILGCYKWEEKNYEIRNLSFR